MFETKIYNRLPFLYNSVITDPKRTATSKFDDKYIGATHILKF
ncbi:hypothetical protein EBME_0704 [bacterium endosymbiont of Mortierella elongata FMR23-6]|nr:hypothetical protein EBME_0704 [bacterium endosymbiont of Mortierella elongata FMR23-6]